jgi:hypothetical protein
LTTGFYIFVGENLITWKSKKQKVVAKSSTEAKYRVMTFTVSELIWVKQVLTDFNFKSEEPMRMYYDNKATRHITTNHVFHERTKHIEVDCHFIREKIQTKYIKTPFVRSQDQLVDAFTKFLSIKAFNDITNKQAFKK